MLCIKIHNSNTRKLLKWFLSDKPGDHLSFSKSCWLYALYNKHKTNIRYGRSIYVIGGWVWWTAEGDEPHGAPLNQGGWLPHSFLVDYHLTAFLLITRGLAPNSFLIDNPFRFASTFQSHLVKLSVLFFLFSDKVSMCMQSRLAHKSPASVSWVLEL